MKPSYEPFKEPILVQWSGEIVSEIRNQLKSQSLEAVVPSSFNEVGGRVFPDEPSVDDQTTLNQIVASWAAVHVPAFGNPIGQSSQTVTKAGAAGEAEVEVLTATKSQVYRVQSIALANGGGAAPGVAKILLGDCPLILDATSAPSSAGEPVLVGAGPFFVDLNSPLKFAVTSGTGTDATLIVNAIKVSQ